MLLEFDFYIAAEFEGISAQYETEIFFGEVLMACVFYGICHE